MPVSLQRDSILREISSTPQWDVIVIGGGATGLGTALDSVTRGYRTLLLEAWDFAKATSSRSTKLVHGGVRYLQQGNVKLVLEALKERGRMLRNAPHLAHSRAFIVPAYQYWEFPFYAVGLTLYDVLAGKEGLGHSKILSRGSALEALPTIHSGGLKGGILYYDGQFDDARYAVSLMRTLFDNGGVALNYARVTALLKTGETTSGVTVEDSETGTHFVCHARVVINATGIFSDELRRLDEPKAKTMLAVSQGSHVVLPREFLPGDAALMVPRTSDGRVLFAIPWHDYVVVGTTDDPVPEAAYDPDAMPGERVFLLDHIEKYLGRRPSLQEISSIWSGQRPLVRNQDVSETAAISREHTIVTSRSKLVTIMGGKWTTYRRMAEDVVNQAAPLAGLKTSSSRTAELRLHGYWTDGTGNWQKVYGSDWREIEKLSRDTPEWSEKIHPRLPFIKAEVVWAARSEMARSVEDVLSRRTRGLFLDARACHESAPVVAHLLAQELGFDSAWESRQVTAFRNIAASYIWDGATNL
jgi:glycerol-3-phosphate dehydrogenase